MSLLDLKSYRLAICVALLFFTAESYAVKSKLEQVPFEYYAEGEPLHDVLAALATSAGISINVSETINERFNGHLQHAKAQDALIYIAAAYDLIWYFDGSTLFVYKSVEMQSQIMSINDIPSRSIKNTMIKLNLWDRRYDWRAIDHSGILMISGPPRYLELVTETIDLLKAKKDSSFSDPLEIKIFKLKYAAAVDRKFTARGDDIVIPGVASILNNIAKSDSDESDKTNVAMQLDPKIKKQSKSEKTNNSKEQQDIEVKSSGAAHKLVQIQADPTLNAVIVQDYKSRIKLYEELIEQLDVPRKQLEISLVIIDLSTNSLEEMGVDWQIANTKVGSGLIDMILPGASTSAADTIIDSNADFLATVSLLETKGQARVTSRPAVVTENGIQAVLDNNETFYVRVQGERVAELEAITYGTILQVTPRIVENDDPIKQIFLDLNIEDGSQVQDNSVDSLPTIKNTQISTRASVPEGASLLIGGYYREGNSFGTDSVPFIGDIPYFGELFKHHKDTTQQFVRLFMISPKIISDDNIPTEYKDDLNQAFSFDKQISDMSSLSNSNGRIFALGNLQPCETSIQARVRRNGYIKNNYTTKISGCRDLDGIAGFRVSLSQCPATAQEQECQL